LGQSSRTFCGPVAEGTAVQMGGAIADQFTTLFKLDPTDRKNAHILGISAGFASVGTPLAGALFALEVLYFSKLSFRSVLLSFIVAYIAYLPSLWQVQHTISNSRVPILNGTILLWIIPSSVFCLVLATMLFSRSTTIEHSI
jgi:H+/Cl- antiporter ClcA